ncbi:MAG: BspA family leucine-rich repeat surface protein, partial [Cyclobacteriaceae bacterium]|nr:BspA family leucine-rich repeat surface protein [Cyclobacteriaceae bacterium]
MNSSESLLSDIPTSLNGPSISSFSPISGPVGTIVTISGSDFGATIEENIVFFGAVRATVITASTTQLEVEVPVGSSFRPISVTVDGLTASSRNSFIVTFPDGVALNNEIFKTQAGLSGFDGYSVATGDLDNDGKADLVIPSYTGGDLLIYRNIGEVGEDITFDTPISIVTEGGPTYVVVADFDGDGKLDIAITLFDSDEIFIYRNTSNDPGEISFDNIPIELEYPNGNWMAVGDFDNDGRPDLAVVNVIDNAVSIFRNTSSDIGNISFDAQQDIPSTSRAFSVAVADLDGDGLVDIGSIGPGPIAAKVHRNTSTGPGDISFAATQDHTVGVESYNIAFADMDGDGKPEMITTRWVGGPQVRVSLNTSIAGSISFDPFSELIAPGNQNDITVADFDGDGKPDFATVSQEGNSISIFKNTSDGVSNLSFASPVTQPVLNSPFVLTNTDFNLDGKPDLVVVSSGNGAAILKNATPFRPFITKWVTDDGNITIPTTGGGYNYTISWFNETSPGDDEGSAINQTGNFMITKLTNGHIYRIEISEDFPRIFFDFGGDSDKIQSVEQWGDIAWTSMEGAFTGCSNLVINASDAPNLSGVTNMKDMFFFASAVNDGLENWDVSNITNMQNLFYGATAFNGNIGAWNVENVTNMSFMFYEALAFNQNLNEWDVGSVTNMSSMFVGASNFDGPIGDWNTSSVTEMGEMFFGASAFNQPIGNWNMSSVVGTFTMFQNATSFNQPIGDWNMESVTNTGDMFNNATAFDQDISLWNVSNVTSMWGMFQGATAFNQNLGDWDVTNTNRASLNMSDMLDNSGMSKANYDATLIGWAAQEPLTPNVTLGAAGLTYCGGASAKLTLEAAGWTVGGEQDCLPFITTWVTDDGNITIPTAGGGGYNYNVTWTNLTNEGQGDGSINGQTENYTIEGLENGSTYQIEITGDFPSIFFNDTGDKDKILTIEQWGEISWQSMEEAFAGCSILRSNATDSPDLSGVTSTLGMFRQASGFTGDLSEWDVSQVTDMRFMFLGASSFNSDLSEWDVGNVTLMTSMFANCTSFNSDLSEWTVGQVINTVSMFNSATQFNSDLSAWDVSNVNNMSAMFQQASSFSSNLGDWNISQVNNMTAIFSLSGLTTEDYDSTLQGWAQRSDLQLNLSVGVAALTYCEGATAREILMDGFNWTFEGDEEDCPEPPASPFITIWKTDNPGSTADNQILIPRTNITGVQDFDLYWEEVGNPDNNGFEMGLTGSPTITFPNPGTYRIEILGNFKFIRFFDSGQQEKLISIEQWGEIEWEAFNAAFRGCSNLVYNATDAPDLLQVDNLSGIFQGCTNFNGDLSNWDVSSITDMSNAFSFTELFNGDISTWDVSNVTNFSAMFRSAFAFNGDIENWEPSNADNMSNMFRATEVFNRDLSRWDLNPGINLFEMFREATAFNGDISTWDVTASTIACMFQDAPLFNQDISGWNIGETTALLALFAGAESFNQDISAWDVSQVTNMQSLFDGASSFDQNLGSWEVGQVDIMNNIFSNSGLSTANYDLILQGWAA